MPQLNFIQGMISLLNFILAGIIIIRLVNNNLKIKSSVAINQVKLDTIIQKHLNFVWY